GPVGSDDDFQTILHGGGGSALAHARDAYAPLLAWLDMPGDDERDDVASAAVFTTQHATFVAPALRTGVYATPAPVARDVMNVSSTPSYTLWVGAYDAPNFQTGDPPYQSSGGEIVYGDDGAAVVQRTETMRFALTLPLGTKPSGGWPICIY